MDKVKTTTDVSMAAQSPSGQVPAVTQPRPVIAQLDGASMMALIQRAATDESIDVDKMERVLAMCERMKAKDAEQAFNEAMTLAQTEIRPIAADASNPQTRSKYASFLALDKALRPIYTRHGFSLSFDTGDAPPEMVRVLCYVGHRDGHSRTYKVDLPADGKGAKGGDVMTKTHAAGAAMTYGQRYLLKLIFNIAVGEDDDNGADASGPLSPDQVKTLRDMLERDGGNLEMFCKFMKVGALSDIRASDFNRAVMAINEAAINRKAKAAKEAKQ